MDDSVDMRNETVAVLTILYNDRIKVKIRNQR